MENENFELRSEEIQDILTKIPNWMIRWGTVVFSFIILSLLLISWFVKYPDIVTTQIVITTNNPPEKLIAKTFGKIEIIFVNNKSNVSKNSPIAVIESSSNYNDVFLLKKITDSLDIEKSNFPFQLFKSARFGEIENSFALFQKEANSNELYKESQPYKVDGLAQNIENIRLKERLNLLISQKSISESELELQKKDLERYQTLFEKGIIASQELEKHKLIYFQTQKSFKVLLSNISQLLSSLNDLNRMVKTTNVNENKDNINLQRNVIQAFFQLKKAIKDWDLNHVLRSSTDGKITFLKIWSKNQFVSAGDNVFTIIPVNKRGYIGKVKALAQNSGKIKIGQQVNIRLANFPDYQFGMLKGKVKSISLVPDETGNILLDVSLPLKLETSFHKIIPFRQEMSGQSEIITEDLRLIERILYQFRDIFRR